METYLTDEEIEELYLQQQEQDLLQQEWEELWAGYEEFLNERAAHYGRQA